MQDTSRALARGRQARQAPRRAGRVDPPSPFSLRVGTRERAAALLLPGAGASPFSLERDEFQQQARDGSDQIAHWHCARCMPMRTWAPGMCLNRACRFCSQSYLGRRRDDNGQQQRCKSEHADGRRPDQTLVTSAAWESLPNGTGSTGGECQRTRRARLQRTDSS